MFLKKLLHVLRLWHSRLRAKYANEIVRRHITKVLEVTHAQELKETPLNFWPIMQQKQAQEIQAVMDGKFDKRDIIDRRSWPYPYLPEALHRLNQPILKNTPYNLRRFSETPIPRRAINLCKNAIVFNIDWELGRVDEKAELDPDMEQRIRIGTEALKRPNNEGSFKELLEPVVEDILVGGYGCIEPRMTPYWKRPFKLWPVDGSTIKIFLDWTESTPDRPRYAQMTGLKGERGIVTFLEREIIYIRDNIRTSTPFGLGRLEVAFNTVNNFLSAQDMAGRAGADQIHKTFLWWEQSLNPEHIQTVRRYIQNEGEGQAKVSLIQGGKKPDVIDIQAVNPADLLLDWQRFMIDIIANAFDLSPMALGQTDKVNKATGQVMADSDFKNAVLPLAKRLEDALTHFIHSYMGWKDLEFRFIGLDDPDVLTRTMIQQREYMMNALLPDEIRKAKGLPPLPGGWGRLSNYQMQILMAEVAAQFGSKVPGAAGGTRMGMGSGSGMGTGTGSGMSMPGGSGMGSGMSFSAQEVAQMNPDEVDLYQMLGLLPMGQQLPDQMEQEAPGILDTISDELREFFQHQQEVEEETQVQPRPVTRADELRQQQRFEESEHQESLAEKVIGRRRVFGPAVNQQITKNAERGKYPRSGGPDLSRNTRYLPGETIEKGTKEVQKNRQLPKGHYRPGKGNRYN